VSDRRIREGRDECSKGLEGPAQARGRGLVLRQARKLGATNQHDRDILSVQGTRIVSPSATTKCSIVDFQQQIRLSVIHRHTRLGLRRNLNNFSGVFRHSANTYFASLFFCIDLAIETNAGTSPSPRFEPQLSLARLKMWGRRTIHVTDPV
jgi:hypothetical protein